MNRNVVLGLLAASTLTISSVAMAQTSAPVDPSGKQAPAEEKTAPPAEDNATPPAESTPAKGGVANETPGAAISTDAKTDAAAAVKASRSTQPAKPAASMEAIKEKAKTLSAEEKAGAEAELTAEVKKVDKEATAKGETTVAGRLAEDLGMSPDALVAEKGHFKTGWGNLMIGHLLLSNAKTSITLQQIFDLRTEGMGWGEIAHGMDMKLGEMIGAAKAESRVAAGLDKPDGKVEAVGHGAGTRAQAGTKVAAKAQAGKAAEVRAKVDAGVGVGQGKTGK